jgi:hypothetical protein
MRLVQGPSLVGALIALSLTACITSSTRDEDAGADPAYDGGPTSVVPPDASAAVPDSGPTSCGLWGGLTATNVAAVPPTCLPRCTNATLARAERCADADCLLAALDADTMPPASMEVAAGAVDSVQLDCGLCFTLQRYHCYSLVCPSESVAHLACDEVADADGCAGEAAALQGCLDSLAPGSREEELFNECFVPQADTCFDFMGGA